jgi:hypothetical protein
MSLTSNPIISQRLYADTSGSAASPPISFGADNSGLGIFLDANGNVAIAQNSLSVAAFGASMNAMKVQKYTITAAQLVSSGSGVALLSGVALPVGAIVTRSFIHVSTSFAGNGDSGSTIKIGIQDQSVDVHASAALSTYSGGMVEGVSTGTAANMKIIATTAKQLAVTWTIGGTDTSLSAGLMEVYLEYVNG